MSGRDERATAIVEFVWLTIVLLMPLVYVVVAVFDTQRTAFAASAAARSAGRAFLTAPDQVTAYARARAAAAQAFRDQGQPASAGDLVIACRPDPDACLTPGSVVTATVVGAAPLPLTPLVFGGQAPAVHVEASHSAPYGDFREARP